MIPGAIELMISGIAYDTGKKSLIESKKVAGQTLFSQPDHIYKIFIKNLRKSIEKKATESNHRSLYHILAPNNWEYISTNIQNINPPTDKGSDILLEEEDRLIEETANSIADLVGINVDDDPELKRDLNTAVEMAYFKTIQQLGEEIKENEYQGEISEFDLELAQAVKDLRDQFNQREHTSPWSDSFDLYSVDDYNQEGIKSLIADYLEIDASFPFIEREGLNEVSSQQKILFKGNPGAGKTRILLEAVSKKVESDTIDYIIVPSHDQVDLEDVKQLSQISIEENLLLVWDDLQEFYSKNRSENIFGRAVRDLEKVSITHESDLHVLAAVRTGATDNVGKLNLENKFWREFDQRSVDSLEYDEIWDFIPMFADYYGVNMDASTKIALAVKTVEADPHPFYIKSAITAATEAGELTEKDVQRYPEEAIGIWEQYFHESISQEEGLKQVLWSIKILRMLGVSYHTSLIEGIYCNVFEGKKRQFYQDIGELEDKGWINEIRNSASGDGLIISHDISLDAVSLGNREDIIGIYDEEISQFLLDELSKYTPNHATWIESILHQNFAILYLLGKKRADNDSIEQHFRQSLTSQSTTPEAYTNYSSYHSGLGNDEKAIEFSHQAVQKWPESFKLRWFYANQLAQSGQLEDAIDQYKRAEAMETEIPEFYQDYGETLIGNKNFEQAKDIFDEAIKLDIDDIKSYIGYAMGADHSDQQIPPHIIKEMEQKFIFSENASEEDALFGIVICGMSTFADQKRIDLYLQRAKEIDSTSYVIDILEAMKLYEDGFSEEPREKLIDVAKEMEENQDKRDRERTTDDGEYAVGFTNFTNIEGEQPTVDTLARLADIQQSTEGEIDTIPLELVPKLMESDKKEDKEEALNILQRAIDEGIVTTPILRFRGNILLELRRLEEGVQNYSKLIELDGSNWTDWLHYGETLKHTERTDQAQNAYWNAFKSYIDEGEITDEGEVNRLEQILWRLLQVSNHDDTEGDIEYWYEECISYIEDSENSDMTNYRETIEKAYDRFLSSISN